jgi:predicted kinase
MPTIILVRGIHASGKSEFARTWAAADPENRVRVCRDDLRKMSTGAEKTSLTRTAERLITRLERAVALSALRAGKDVLIDGMNLKPYYVRPWLSLGYPVEFVDFPVTLDLALARNDARGGNIPEEVIRSAYATYTPDGQLPEPPELETTRSAS